MLCIYIYVSINIRTFNATLYSFLYGTVCIYILFTKNLQKHMSIHAQSPPRTSKRGQKKGNQPIQPTQPTNPYNRSIQPTNQPKE